jgi:hypothetical protein
MATPHKFQHYVPQCYLRHFAHQDKKNGPFYLHAFSKESMKIFDVPVDKVCGAKDFYSLSDDFIQNRKDDSVNSLSLEVDYFAKNDEPQYSETLKEVEGIFKDAIENHKDKLSIDNDLRKAISFHIAIQHLRLPFIREKINQKTDTFLEKITKIVQAGIALEQGKPELADLSLKAKYDKVANHARFGFANIDRVKEYTNSFAEGYWFFFYSFDNNFYTSDIPIQYYQPNNLKGVDRPINYGSEIMFPILPNLLLVSFDRNYYSNYKENDCSLLKANKRLVHFSNYFHMKYAKQFVFSYTGNFDMVFNDEDDKLIKQNIEL